MARTFILMSCLLSITMLYADSLSTGCCGKRKRNKPQNCFIQTTYFNDGCSCEGGVGDISDDLPPDSE